jgi:hypothetical protein
MGQLRSTDGIAAILRGVLRRYAHHRENQQL